MDLETLHSEDVAPTPNTNTNPRLPPELEHEIFALAFYNDEKGQITLFRVSKRVFDWLIPLFYRIITISPNASGRYKYPPTSTLRKYGHHVHHLYAVATSDPLPITESDLFSLCPNVYNLGLWFDTYLPPNVLDLPIKRLITDDFGFLPGRWATDPNEVRLRNWCSNITHLLLGDYGIQSMRYLVHFPALKYFAAVNVVYHDDQYAALTYCPNLKVFVDVRGSVTDKEKTTVIKDYRDGNKDIRIVKVDGFIMMDWVRGAKGLPDMWELAEREVEKRESMC